MTGMYLEHYGVKGMKWRNHRKSSNLNVKKALDILSYNNKVIEQDRNRQAQLKLAEAQYQAKKAGHEAVNKENQAKVDAAKQAIRDLNSNYAAKKAVDIGTSAISKLFGKSKKK